MANPVVPINVFITGQPVQVRLTETARIALGIPDADVDLIGASLMDGWFIATYQNGETNTRYLLPPSSILYAKQDQPQS